MDPPERIPDAATGFPREFIRVGDQIYVIATSALAEDRTRVLKHGDTFGVFDRYGDIQPVGVGGHGLYHRGTRFLSREEMLFDTGRPLLLASHLEDDNLLLTVDVSNPDLSAAGENIAPRNTLHVMRSKVLWDGACYERMLIFNYGLRPATFKLRLHFEADFRDVFEVRGIARPRRGLLKAPEFGGGAIRFHYHGLDDVERVTHVTCAPPPTETHADGFSIAMTIESHGSREFELCIACRIGEQKPEIMAFGPAHDRNLHRQRALKGAACKIRTSNEQFDAWLARSLADINLMVTDTPFGYYPYAGTPWFGCPFGRDGILSALEMLWVNPQLAAGTLRYLAAMQADRVDLAADAQPGKIVHEVREGEMPALGEVPFARYYGTVDATPLFVYLAAEYLRATGDIELIRGIYPHIAAALRWIDAYGDIDGDGFVEYLPNERGLINQGWKDSGDAVFHADGQLARGAVALCEVQAYVYAARRAAAEIAELLQDADTAANQARKADALREQFDRAFWDEGLGLYVLALDGEKRPCRVASSNAGQCLFSGIALPERAARVVHTLMESRFFTGWGIRTIATGQSRYNPMSYHNGSVWPHDNALIALGFARYGHREAAGRIMGGLFDASLFFELQRLPELFCGFERRRGEGPIQYPLACAPQAWAAASVFMLVAACLGLEPNAARREARFERPTLPPFIEWMEISGLTVNTESVDLLLERSPHSVSVILRNRPERLRVCVVK